MAINKNVLAEKQATVLAEDGNVMYATIQMRHGKESEMDKSKFAPAEMGVATDKKKAFMAFAPNDVKEIAFKEDLDSGGGGGTGGTTNYNNLSNKPQLNGVTLEGNKTLDQVGVLAKNQGSSNSGKFLSVGSDGNVVPADAPSGGSVDPEQIKQAVNGYLEENPPSGMTAEQEKQLNQNTTDVADLKSDIEFLSKGFYNIPMSYTSGGIDKSNGSFTENANLKRSDKINYDDYMYVDFYTDDTPGYALYTTVFEYDNEGNFVKVLVDTVKQYRLYPTKGHTYAITVWFGSSDFGIRLEHFFAVGKVLVNIEDLKEIRPDDSAAKLDIPDKLFIIKGNTLELFKYGMYYSDSEYISNEYNVRVVNIDQYVKQYSDKIVITCPPEYDSETLRNSNDLPLFQLLNKHGEVIEQKRVSIYVADADTLDNIDRTIMYLGDSLTGMGYRSGETARLFSEETNLTKTRLIGKFAGSGDGNHFTGSGGYSWANYAENPSTLPSTYPNNYLWNDLTQSISMSYLLAQIGETNIDYVIILLGWNDYESGAFSGTFSWETMGERVKKVIETIHDEYPRCKVILESYHYMYPFDRKSYGNTMPQVRHNKYIYDLNGFYQSISNEYDYVEFLQMSCCIDVLHNMNMVEEIANKRTTEKVKYCSDVVHPADIGFYQYSDNEVAVLLYLFFKSQ